MPFCVLRCNSYYFRSLHMTIESFLISKLIEWNNLTQSLSIHRGINGDRVQEFQNWFSVLPLSTLYRVSEGDRIVDYNSIEVSAKAVFAAAILIIDDVVDNSNEDVLSLFGTNLLNYNRNVPIFANQPLMDSGVRIVYEILNEANVVFSELGFTEFPSILNEFLSGVNEEIKMIVNLMVGESLLFNTRLFSSYLQGATPAVLIDVTRNVFNNIPNKHEIAIELSLALNAYLALRNSQATVISEILNHEISSPLYILACEITNTKPFEKIGELQWYQSIERSPAFRDRLAFTLLNLRKSIDHSMLALDCNSRRLFEAVNIIYK